MQPLIKWPGGKTNELIYIKDLLPSFDRYIEPFFGGGAVFFNISFNEAIINDINDDLIDLYRFIKGEYDHELLVNELQDYVDKWEKIPNYIALFEGKFFNLYKQFKNDLITNDNLNYSIREYINLHESEFNGLFDINFCVDDKNLIKQISKNLNSKLQRIKKLESIKGSISDIDLHKNIETAFRSGFYMHFRDLMNKKDIYKLSKPKQIANYYFIREFCYGSMFRYNAKGEFNIPYGGIAYNTKNFRKKVNYLFSQEVQNLFKKTIIEKCDFEVFFRKHKFAKNDFIFLDPPYDTEFSSYENKTFDQLDQERLAKCLYDIHANFLLIIKDTPFIKNLYKNKNGIKVESFEKKYLYNVKGRNIRDVNHLIIYNY